MTYTVEVNKWETQRGIVTSETFGYREIDGDLRAWLDAETAALVAKGYAVTHTEDFGVTLVLDYNDCDDPEIGPWTAGVSLIYVVPAEAQALHCTRPSRQVRIETI